MPPLSRLVELLTDHARTDPALADALREAAEALLAGLAPLADVAEEAPPPAKETAPPAAESTPPAEEDALGAPATAPAEPSSLDPSDVERLVAWAREGGTQSDGDSSVPAGIERGRDAVTDTVLAPLAARFRLKAAAARWHAEGADPARMPELRSRFGEVEGLGTEMLDDAPEGTPDAWGRLAAAFETAGTAADVLSAFADAGRVLRSGTPFAEAVVAAAEAQSAVRAAYWALRGERADEVSPTPRRDDPEQVSLFRWLREATEIDQVYVERHMRWQDPADPARAEAVTRHLRGIATSAGVSLQEPRPTATARHLKAVGYHADRLAQDPEHWDAEHQCERLLDRLDAAVEAGVAPTDTRLRSLLAPIAGALPDADDPALTPRTQRVLAALYDHLYNREDEDEHPTDAPAPRPPHVEQAARLLAGKQLALFGGVPRPEAETALAEALDLGGVEWVETRAHQSTAPFEAVVARSDVAVQLIRWSSHSFGDLRDQCAAYGTHFVRAPGGYSPSAIARNVLDQISESLRSDA